ncbi:MAG: DUF2027 domain-containing protein [Bacteroidales bacterium]|jgi:hypothetical protein|nr:DUF2027 domain-containing protein [Bacteroidales bacterium]MDI9576175.1 DUF2027 domain-containing protein [Bacteroidota bacterium]MDD2593151.1 DUF2027 domain-containing protein [Bacteroidales bacterium]MDD3755535.1 DUF2027 domain-containing protein [Bacteroidales bacterium]MDY0400678.1 DUF2027 domain-containing protein [Bacteroidales bacterium]
MKFKKGDKVKYLDEIGEGIVKEIHGDLVIVEDDLGFEIPMKANKLILVEHSKNMNNIDDTTDMQDNIIEGDTKTDLSILSNHNKSKIQQFTDGIYLVIKPENPKVPIASPHQLYLVNFTSYDVYFLLHQIKVGNTNIYHSFLNDYTAIKLENLKIEDMPNELLCTLQSIIISKEHIFLPFISTFAIKRSTLLKEDNYSENPFFDEPTISILIKDLKEINELKNFEKQKDELEINFSKSKERLIVDASIIDKYLVSPELAEVDLHLEKLVDDPQNISPDMALNIQLSYFKQCLDAAISKDIDKIIFIHGVGAGILKREMYQILKNYPDLYYGDAPIRQYGIGATEVYIKPIKK